MKKSSNSQKSQKRAVKTKCGQEGVTIGMDLGDKTSRYCLLSKLDFQSPPGGIDRPPTASIWRAPRVSAVFYSRQEFRRTDS